MKNIIELSMFLCNKCHQALWAGCSQGNIITAALLPKQVQSRSLKLKAWDTSNEKADADFSSFISKTLLNRNLLDSFSWSLQDHKGGSWGTDSTPKKGLSQDSSHFPAPCCLCPQVGKKFSEKRLRQKNFSAVPVQVG